MSLLNEFPGNILEPCLFRLPFSDWQMLYFRYSLCADCIVARKTIVSCFNFSHCLCSHQRRQSFELAFTSQIHSHLHTPLFAFIYGDMHVFAKECRMCTRQRRQNDFYWLKIYRHITNGISGTSAPHDGILHCEVIEPVARTLWRLLTNGLPSEHEKIS